MKVYKLMSSTSGGRRIFTEEKFRDKLFGETLITIDALRFKIPKKLYNV